MPRSDTVDDLFSEIPSALAQTRALSAPGLRSLLDLAFRASLLREEGRSPRLLLFAPANRSEEPPMLVRFSTPQPLTLQLIRRISPSIVPGAHALEVSGSAKRLDCDGIAVVDPQQLVWSLLPRTSLFEGITISIEAPGALSLVSSRRQQSGNREILVISLRGGAISKPYPFWSIATMNALLEACVQTVVTRHVGEKVPPKLPQALIAVIDALISEAVEFGHGGTFVFLPPTTDHKEQKRNLAPRLFPPATADLGRLLVEMLHSEEQPYHEVSQRLLLQTTKAVGRLSGVDGCVVLDYGLCLKMFGARITTSDAVKPKIRPIDPWSHRGFKETRPLDAPQLSTLGTRHHSAARLCAAIPGTTAIVISQDADIRVFQGAGGYVADCGALAFIPAFSHVPKRPPP